MDIAKLAQDATVILTPFLPYLLTAGKKAGGKAVEEVGKEFTDEAWQQAQALWAKLRHKPAVQSAAEDVVVALPADTNALAALRLQIKKLLTEDALLAAEVAGLIQTQVVQTILAESGGTIRRVVQKAKGDRKTKQSMTARGSGIIEDAEQKQE
jgi:hypothetical protein